MAAILFTQKDGEAIEHRVDALEVTNLLQNGYFSTKEQALADTNETGKLSNKEIRQAAKDAGIDNWQKGNLSKIKKELGYE